MDEDDAAADRFGLGGACFAVDRGASSVAVDADGLVTVVVRAGERIAAGGGDADRFGWAVSPPVLCLRAVPAAWAGGTATVRIDDDLCDAYDVSLYLGEHGDITGTLTLRPGRWVRLTGHAQVSGRPEPLALRVALPL